MKITLIDKNYYTSSTEWNTAFADKANSLSDAEWGRYAFLASSRIKNIVNKYFENLTDLDLKERGAVQQATAIMIDYWMEYGINLNRISGSVSLGGYSASENPPSDPDYIPFMVYEVLQTVGLYTFAGMAFSECNPDNLPQQYQWNGLKYPFKFAVYAKNETELNAITDLAEQSYGYNIANQHWYVFTNDQWKDLGNFTIRGGKGDDGQPGKGGIVWLTDEYADLNEFANKAPENKVVKYNINADGTNNSKGFVILIKTAGGIEELRTWEEIKEYVAGHGGGGSGTLPKGTLEEIYKVGKGQTVDESDTKYANIDELGKLMAQNFETNGEKMVKTADNIVLYSKGTYHNGLTNGKVRYMDAFSGIFINEYDVEITNASLFYQYTYKSAANIWNRLSAWQSAFGAKSLHNETTVNYHFNDKHNYKFSINKDQTYEMTIDEKFEANQLVKYLTLKTNGQLHGANAVNHTTAAQSADGYQIKLSEVMTPAHPNADIIFTFKADLNEGDTLLELQYTSPPQALVDRYSNAIKNAATKAQIDSLIAQVAQLGTAVQVIENTWTGDRIMPSTGITDLSAVQGDKGAFEFDAGKKLIFTFGTAGHAVSETKVLKVGTQGSFHLIGEGIDATFSATLADTGTLTIQNFTSTGATSIVMHDIIIKEMEQNPKQVAVIDAYTKAETDTKLGLKADKTAIYDRTTLDAKFTAKADAATTYTKTQVDTELAEKADQATTYTKTEVDTELGKKANQATTYTKTEVDTTLKLYAKLENNYNPIVSHQAGYIIFNNAGIADLPVGSRIQLDMSWIDSLITNPSDMPAAGDQTFIGTTGAIRIPNSVGTAALKWETKTNPGDPNVKDNYKTKLFELEKVSSDQYNFIKLLDKPEGLTKAGLENILTIRESDIVKLKDLSVGTKVGIGKDAGHLNQGANTVAIGNIAGRSGQKAGAIAIGKGAGEANQGTNAIAIGENAGSFDQKDHSIIISASGLIPTVLEQNEILIETVSNKIELGSYGFKINNNVMFGKSITLTFDDGTTEVIKVS